MATFARKFDSMAREHGSTVDAHEVLAEDVRSTPSFCERQGDVISPLELRLFTLYHAFELLGTALKREGKCNRLAQTTTIDSWFFFAF